MNINKNILVIDDDCHIRRVIELKLKNAGYEVLLARNGEEGLKLIKDKQPSVVITDVVMPKMGGRELCIATNKIKKEKDFLTIVITCSMTFDEKIWISGIRNTKFMEKPFSLNRLLECIDTHFGIERQ